MFVLFPLLEKDIGGGVETGASTMSPCLDYIQIYLRACSFEAQIIILFFALGPNVQRPSTETHQVDIGTTSL